MGARPKLITIDGETKTFSSWCEHYNISREAVKDRMRDKGMTFEQALKEPKFVLTKHQVICTLPSGNKVTYKSIHEAAQCYDVMYSRMAYRLKKYGYAEFNGYRFELDS